MLLDEFELLTVGRVAPDPAWRVPAQTHPHHELIVVLDGVLVAVMPGKQALEARPGHVLLYPAGVQHEEYTLREAPLESVFLAFLQPRLPGGRIVQVQDTDGRMRMAARWLIEGRHDAGDWEQEERMALARLLLAAFCRATDRPQSELVRRTRAFIRGRIADRLTLGALAAQAGLSRHHFLRVYKAQAGRTPMQDVRVERVLHARDLLQTTSLAIKEIAPRCGLGDQYSMSRAFRMVLGAPPGRFRPGRSPRAPAS
jgi:AraC-like DNA-binding protein